MGRTVRSASHAGTWYSKSKEKLAGELDGWLAAVNVNQGAGAQAIIAPHAGYSYSGPTAAWAYRYIDPERVDRVFILGPSHHFYLSGCALTSFQEYATPLGNLRIDTDVVAQLHKMATFDTMDADVDEAEHSIELHLPYLYHVMSAKSASVSIVPVLVGNLSAEKEERFGHLFAPFLEDPRNLFIISSDFCHWGSRFGFAPYDPSHGPIHQSIEAMDQEAIEIIKSVDPQGFLAYLKRTRNTICGRHPIAVLLFALQKLTSGGATPRIEFTRYAQSSRVTGISDSSVSYASAVCNLNSKE